MFGGQLGGPMEALGPLVGENLGVERAPIEVREDGLRHSVKIGDAVDFEVEDVVPFGVESGEPARLVGIFHPAGSELTIAKATRSSINAFGIEYEGKSASRRRTSPGRRDVSAADSTPRRATMPRASRRRSPPRAPASA